jgi:hypothetical protein
MAENQRLKNELDNSRARHNKLSKKLMETESNLKQALSTRRNGKKTSANEESSIARTHSIKHVLDNTVAEKVALTQSRSVYKSKVALRESLFHSMTTEVKVLNELKRDCEEIACEPSIEMQSDIRDREDNVQAILIQMELVEKHIEDLQARFPKIDDHAVDDITFNEDEPSLKIISKLNWSDLRALLLCYLSSAYAYEVSVSHKRDYFPLSFLLIYLNFTQLDRKGLKDELGKKEVTLRMMDDELAARGETIDRLMQSINLSIFRRQHSDGSTQEDAYHSAEESTSAIPFYRKSIDVVDNVDEGIPEYLMHKSAPQDEEHIAVRASCSVATLSSTEVVTPITARSLSTSSKFDSLKQRYLKKVRNK